MTQKEAHEKLVNIIDSKLYTQIEIAAFLGISTVTLKKRLKSGKLRIKEVKAINSL